MSIQIGGSFWHSDWVSYPIASAFTTSDIRGFGIIL
jgi:hypothetical protein